MNQTNAEYRHELKFIISNTQRIIIENSLQGVMQKDAHLNTIVQDLGAMESIHSISLITHDGETTY